MSKQYTINSSFSLSGKGLHTGLNIEATFLPAEENTGIIFKRVDLEGAPEIPAIATYVSATERGTNSGDAFFAPFHLLLPQFLRSGMLVKSYFNVCPLLFILLFS